MGGFSGVLPLSTDVALRHRVIAKIGHLDRGAGPSPHIHTTTWRNKVLVSRMPCLFMRSKSGCKEAQ